MPTLSSSNSLFELAFGVNAVLPVLISDFEAVKHQTAESLLRKIKEVRPKFKLIERDRLDFVDFTVGSIRGYRFANHLTRVVGLISLFFCGASLGVLYWSAHEPDLEIKSNALFAFVLITLIVGPIIYEARNRYLKWLYSKLVTHGTNEKADAVLFAECADMYLRSKKKFETLDREMKKKSLQAQILIYRMKIMLFWMKLEDFWHSVRLKCLSRRAK